MENKRVLVVTQELHPYVGLTDIADVIKELPQYMQEEGMEIRVLMPCFGSINERRNRLHEVVRLSGINIVVNDDDYPLIIKVASLPGARIQVYFLDNEDLFKEKAIFRDDKNNFYGDNAERMIFFCKGVLETVKKFGWAPDIIHLHGWMTSLIPLYLKTAYKDEPIFENAKTIYSLYNNTFKETLDQFADKAPINNSVEASDLKFFEDGTFDGLNLGAISYSDAIVHGSSKNGAKINNQLKAEKGKPTLSYVNGGDHLQKYMEFYEQVLES
jgi:starch synthase